MIKEDYDAASVHYFGEIEDEILSYVTAKGLWFLFLIPYFDRYAR